MIVKFISALVLTALLPMFSTMPAVAEIESGLPPVTASRPDGLEIALADKPAAVKELYAQRHYMPLWFVNHDPSVAFQAAKKTILNAESEGLALSDYAQTLKTAEDHSQPWAIRELAMTTCVLSYLHDLIEGNLTRAEGKKWNGHGGINSLKGDYHQLFYARMLADPTGSWLITYSNEDQIYQRLKEALSIQRALKEKSIWPDAILTKTLRKGMKNPEVRLLRQLLVRHGIGDPDIATPGDQDMYDDYVMSAVGVFQEKMGLKKDGLVGRRTREIINLSPAVRMMKIRIAMERWRWLPPELGAKHVMVNIPWFEMQLIDDHTIVDRMPVIIGKPIRKTPVFSTYIRGVRLNPAWNVPYSIASKSKLRKLKKDPGCLAKSHFIVMNTKGEPIDPQTVNWEQVTRKTFTYRLRQAPGDYNALGRVRLLMHNPYAIFAHGTDVKSQRLFNYDNRSFSSGCMRMKDPLRVAEFLLDDQSKWSRSNLDAVIATDKTKEVALTGNVPIHVVYFTAWPQQDGSVQFRPDLYGMDAEIEKSLSA